MDNRRIIRSYREKQANAAASTPYTRSESGLFSKMKSFFTPSSLWAKDQQQSQQQQQQQLPQQSTPQPQKQQPSVQQKVPGIISESSLAVEPFKFPESELNTPRKPSSTSSASTDVFKTPNHVLTSFFQARGDKPLSEVEYEGVVALLSKSRSNTPATVKVSQQQRDSLYNRTIQEEHEDERDLNNDSEHLANSSVASGLFVTPYNQKVLKNNGTAFATPEYKPVYHTVSNGNGQGNGRISSVPSVKRVYQFSGLPSPYRTRIRTPNLSARKQKQQQFQQKQQQQQSQTLETSVISSLGENSPIPSKKSLSSAANTLLSILDGESHEQPQESSIKAFSSPYAKPKRTREEQPTPMKKKRLTAGDIAKSMSYDKSEKLPEVGKVKESTPVVEKFASVTEEKSKTEEMKKEEIPVTKKAEPFTFKPIVNQPSTTSTFSTGVTPAPVSTVAPTTTTSVPLFAAAAPVAPVPAPVATPAPSNGATVSIPITKNTNSTSNGKPAFQFGTTTKPSVETNPTDKPKLDVSFSIAFPSIKPNPVHLDLNKVESYKQYFEF
ncbi:hypothetical protein CAAN1_17S00276 [[Candida] anglica]|uniref:Nucleoporin Nup60 n=1 Tax=[Candida] anglica TaxID=148631 RepID=A0ABP0E7L7_9ASCO